MRWSSLLRLFSHAKPIAVLLGVVIASGQIARANDSATRDYTRATSRAAANAGSEGTHDLYGLVVGIDKYDAPIQTLDGAGNDADDVASALRQRNARKVWLLKDKDATRDHIKSAWQEMIALSKPGDTILVHLAGHGARSAERVPGTGTDGLDEFFVLPGFKFSGQGTRERIINKEWGGMLRDVPQLKVIFVADTCHSGSMTRDFSPRKLKARVAYAHKVDITDDALPPPDPATWVVRPDQVAHVAFFGAVGQDELDPEILIKEVPRGALSWAVANGLRGAADLNKDGIVTKDELVTYVRDNVVSVTEGEQHPRFQPGQVDLKLFVAPVSQPMLPAPPLSLEILNVNKVSPEDLAKGLHNVVLANDGRATDLTWDVTHGKLRNQTQDTLIFPPGTAGANAPAAADEATRDYRRVAPQEATAARDGKADLSYIQAAIDKKALSLWLTDLGASQPLTVTLSPRDTVQHKGDQAVLTVSESNYPFLTVVNIGPSGNINLIYPIPGDPLQVPKGQPYKLDLTADGPFGAENFVAISSEKPLAEFQKGLTAIDGKPEMEVFKRLVINAVRDTKFQMGNHVVFTAP